MIKLAKKRGIPMINIVRSETSEKVLKDQGAENVFNSSSETFIEDISESISSLEANVFIECVGDKNVKAIMQHMPILSTVIFYGSLQPGNLDISSTDILFSMKTLTYFTTPSYLQTISREEKQRVAEDIMKDYSEGGNVYGTKIYKKYPLKDLDLAIEDYSKHSSQGKLVISMEE